MSRNVRRLLVTALTMMAAVGAAVALAFAGAFQFLEPEIPDASQLRDVRMQVPLQIFSSDGRLMAQIGEQRRTPVVWEQIPDVVVDAFLAAEDDRFFEHPGVDWQGLVRATLSNISAGGVREGGGTITMQLARNTVLSSERTLRRKLKEVFLALRLEREFRKEEILTLYLNQIFLGQRAYGIGAAAKVYFDKALGDLDLAEAALIAGLPRSPSRDNPVASVDRARDRRAYVLRRMFETGKINESARDAALAEPVEGHIYGPNIELEAGYVSEMARAAMIEEFGSAALTDGYKVWTTVDSGLQQAANAATRRAILDYERRHGYRGAIEQIGAAAIDPAAVSAVFGRHPDRGGMRAAIVESVTGKSAVLRDRDGIAIALQWEDLSWARRALEEDKLGPAPKAAADVLAAGDLVYLEPVEPDRYRLAQMPAVAGALVALDPLDGAIVALVGGFDFQETKYNRAVQAKRQPGSAFKPFLYSAALEKGFTPATLVNDAPIVLANGDASGEDWRPQNYSRKFYGPTRMREGLIRSRNLISIRLLQGTGIGPAIRHIAAFGFEPEALPPNLTLALGTGQVAPLEMARGYSVFANGGYRVTPYFIKRITSAEDTTVFEAMPQRACPQCASASIEATVDGDAAVATDPQGLTDPAQAAPQAISPANAYVMTDMMRDVIREGTGRRAMELGRQDLAGKTGTTNDRRDAWFVGFNADLAVATWVGFDQERSLGDREEGGRTALPMWMYFMAEALRDKPEHVLPEPPGVVRMWVSRRSGLPTGAGTKGAIFESFLAEHTPQPGLTDYYSEIDAETAEPVTSDESLF
jgi:penicillin-binding protein 1A